MPTKKPIVEILYPEFGNQSGDNGNELYLKACVEKVAKVVETHYGEEPAFAKQDVAFLMMNSLTEHHQELAARALLPHKERMLELAQAGTVGVFTHSAAEVLGKSFGRVDGGEEEGLGIFDFTTRLDMPTRYKCAFLGSFNPLDGSEYFPVLGFKIQFTQLLGGEGEQAFCSAERGFGRREGNSLEGFRKNNFFATSLIGPLLPINPSLTRWLLKQAGFSKEPLLAYEDVVEAGYAERLKEFTVNLPRGKELSC